jgi:hypothetical protein
MEMFGFNCFFIFIFKVFNSGLLIVFLVVKEAFFV